MSGTGARARRQPTSSSPYTEVDEDGKPRDRKTQRCLLLTLLVLLFLCAIALGIVALIFSINNMTQTPRQSVFLVDDCTGDVIPVECTDNLLGTVILCNNTLILYNCTGADTGWSDVGNIRSALVAVNQTGSDGQVLAWDTATNGWVARGDPVYYGSGTQGNGGGTGSITFGNNASTTGSTRGIAVGDNSVASSAGALALGYTARASGSRSIALGQQSAAGADGISIGVFSAASGAFGIAVGKQATVGTSAVEGVALGHIAVASALQTISIGTQAVASAATSIAVGPFTLSDGVSSVSLGFGASSNLIANAISLGEAAQPFTAAYAFALSLNSASVTTVALGVTLNTVGKVIPHYGAYYAATGGAGPTTLTVNSAHQQIFTTAQTVNLPVVSTLNLGFHFEILNLSSGSVTVRSSGANTKIILANMTAARLVCIAVTGTTDASWAAMGPVPLI